MKVVSVINYKGGVGKTTLTANLGAYAASRGHKVLMIDLDPQTHLTFSFINPEYWQSQYAAARTLKNYFASILNGTEDLPLSALTIPLKFGNYLGMEGMKLDIISSHLELIDIDIDLAALINATNKERYASTRLKAVNYLRRSLYSLREEYDLVLIDCPPSFNISVQNAVTASDYYLIPAKLEYLSMLGISQLTRKIKEYQGEYADHMKTLGIGGKTYSRVTLALLGVVPMMVNIQKETPIGSQERYRVMLKEEGYSIYQYVRNNSTLFGVEPDGGLPVVLTRPKINFTAKRIVKELQELGREIIQSLGLE